MRLFHFSFLFTFITGFNSSEEDPDSSRIPYTDRDLSSLSQDGSPGTTRLPGTFVFGSESVPQGGAHSGSDDKTRPSVVPQEIRHNGQETAASAISDPVHTGATDPLTDSSLSFTEKGNGLSLASAGTQWRGLSLSSLAAETSVNSNTDVNTLVHVTEVRSDTHRDFAHTKESKTFHSGDLTMTSSAPTASPPHVSTLGSRASVTESETLEALGIHKVTGVSVTSPSSAAGEDRTVTHHSVTSRLPNNTNPDLSITDESDALTESSYARDLTSPDSATTHTSHTEHTALERTSEADTQRTSSENFPTHLDLRSGSLTWTRQDFTWTPASYSASAPGQDEGTSSNTPRTIKTHGDDSTMTLHGDLVPYDTTGTQSSAEVLVKIQNETDNAITETSSPSRSAEPGTAAVTLHTSSTSRELPETPTSPNAPVTPPPHLTSPYVTVTTSTPPETIHTSQSSPPATTTHILSRLTTSRNTPTVPGPDTTTTTTPQRALTDTSSYPGTHTPVVIQTSSVASKTHRDWSQKGRVFITEDQPAVISAETFQVLLQVVLEENSPPNTRLLEVERFLQNVAGYQSQDVTWHSGAVLQSVVTFRTEKAVSWLGGAESPLKEAGLRPLPKQGVFVSGIRVKNITVGGLHSDVCSWLFSCPSNFFCMSSEGNVSCRSVCHSDYCKNHGICVHRTGQNPLCQCPVGEDFWFMGQRCDLRMTRQRLAGVCFGVLVAIAALMALLAYLAVLRFKRMLIQAKAEQTQSSYRRFNHFDELSARFWRRSWPGSVDSLDNTAFSHSDELLHMRAMDRACCYHDDTLSIASTYPDSVTHLNTVYPHGSQYHWDMSMCSLADGVIDSGKASDLSVCSWPIEPIQWTPFPLLQQLRSANTVKPTRPRSYCEGMELVGLEKSRTA